MPKMTGKREIDLAYNTLILLDYFLLTRREKNGYLCWWIIFTQLFLIGGVDCKFFSHREAANLASRLFGNRSRREF